MKCARPSCPYDVEEGKGHEASGKVYCCEKCALECTDQQCVCEPEDVKKG